MIISTGLANMEKSRMLPGLPQGGERASLLPAVCLSYLRPSIDHEPEQHGTLRRDFGGPVGLADHTRGIPYQCCAVAMGANLIEKHFTLDRNMEGPDHPFAIEPTELSEMIRQIRDVESALGDGRKLGPAPEEKEFYEKARRSIHAACDIPRGPVITGEMLCTKRPGYGIRPKFYPLIAGRVAKQDISADQWISWR